VSWRELRDERLELVDGSFSDIPVELRTLASLLMSATFETADGVVRATDPGIERRIEREVSDLLARYLSVRVTVSTSGEAIALFATGYVPNYDDIESVAASNPVSVGSRYEVQGWQSVASADQLRESSTLVPDSVARRYLQLPETVSDETRGLALSITQGTTTTFDAALAIQTYLRVTYPYEEAISGPRSGVDAVHYFLFDEQQGYCEYFASAMVVMLRSLDVPARLVSGLMEVPWDADAGGYLYRQEQAHTWVEVYFDEYGWVPFEPTPARGAFDYERDEAEQDDPPTPTPAPLTPTVESEPTATVEPTPDAPTGIATIDQGSDGGRPWVMGGLIASGLALAGSLFWLAIRTGRSRRLSAPGEHYYGQLVRLARRSGVLPSSTTTPRELAEQIRSSAPAVAGPAADVATLYRKELYGGQVLTPEDRQIGESAIKRIKTLLRSSRLPWVRRSGSEVR
jgi:transglutaminase-like putative cysteine protease